jgi:hypothetical protein
MSRVRKHIEVQGQQFCTLFDTGARNTYIVPEVADLVVTSRLAKPVRSALGGSIKKAKRTALLEGTIEGHPFSTHAMVLDEIGKDEDGNPIEILFGALAMQQWGIRPLPDKEQLDLSHYSKEFLEF